jgi:CSLREA domain-containing protein
MGWRSFRSPSRRAGRRRPVLCLEQLESRFAPAVITVNTTADDNTPNDGSVSLREAIQAINNGTAGADTDISNQNPGMFGNNDTINFNISAAGVVQTINVGGTFALGLPAITKPMTINGYSEKGAGPNTLGSGDNAKILIELNGANAGPNADGLLVVVGGAGSTIEGLAINRFSLNGIELQGGGDTITGNFVGTNPRGNAAEPNQNDGIHISNCSSNIVGGTTPGDRNIASGNQIDGIHIVGSTASPATGNLIEGNFVGVNAAGTGLVGIKAIGGAAGTPGGNFVFGIEISGGNANTVGGSSAGAGNVVGLNAEGIGVDNGSEGNVIQGNLVGVGADGVTPVGNNLHGIDLRSSDNLSPPWGPGQANEPAVSGNIIGLNPNTNFTGLGNLVAFNGTGGIAIFDNPLPNNATPIQNTGNSILGNSVFENGRSNPSFLLGIDLTNGFVFPKDDGFTPNDSKGHGTANDPNNFQNSPILTSAVPIAGGVQVTGSLTQSVSPNTTYRIEIFASNPDPLGGIPEGQELIAAAKVTTNAAGTVPFSFAFPANVAAGQIVTADATNLTADPSSQPGAINVFNTSELSPGVFIGTQNQLFVIKAFRDLLGRLPDATGLAGFTGLLDQGETPGQLVLQIENDPGHEYYSRVVQTLYQFYLHRGEQPSDGLAPASFVNFLVGGGTIEQLRALFTSSDEYFAARGGGTNAGFINALYLDAFNTPNRLATDAGAQAFKQLLDSQTLTRAQVSAAIFASGEFERGLVQAFYGLLLNRAPNNNEVSAWASELAAGVTDQQVIAQILGSLEGFLTPPKP